MRNHLIYGSDYSDFDVLHCSISEYLDALNYVVQVSNYDVQSINSESGKWLGFIGVTKTRRSDSTYQYFTLGGDMYEGSEFYNIVVKIIEDNVIPSFANVVNPVTDFNKKEFFEASYQAQIDRLEGRISNIQREMLEKLKELKKLKDSLSLVDSISEKDGLDITDTDNVSGLHIVDNRFITYRLKGAVVDTEIEDDMDDDIIDEIMEELYGVDSRELREEDRDQYDQYYYDIEEDYIVNEGSHSLNIPDTIITIDISNPEPENIGHMIHIHSNNRTQIGMSGSSRITPHTVYNNTNGVTHRQCFGSLNEDLVEACALGNFDYLTELIKKSLRTVNITDGAGMYAGPWFNNDMSPPVIGDFKAYRAPEPELPFEADENLSTVNTTMERADNVSTTIRMTDDTMIVERTTGEPMRPTPSEGIDLSADAMMINNDNLTDSSNNWV